MFGNIDLGPIVKSSTLPMIVTNVVNASVSMADGLALVGDTIKDQLTDEEGNMDAAKLIALTYGMNLMAITQNISLMSVPAVPKTQPQLPHI